MNNSSNIVYSIIAPCGMNCSICLAFLRERNVCLGCRGNEASISNHCVTCIIRNCTLLNETSSKFCYECSKFPCTRLKQLDKRYRLKYNMSMLENLQTIKNEGLDTFMEKEKERWKCPDCGGNICVHRGHCMKCKPSLIH